MAIAIETSWFSVTKSKRTIATESRPCLQASSAFILSIHVPTAGSTPRSIAIAIGFAIAIETLWLSLSAVPTAQVESTNPKRIIRIESHPCLQLSSAFILTIHVPDTGSTPRSIAIAIGIAIAIAIGRHRHQRLSEHEIQRSRLAASFRKTSGPTNWERIDSDPDSDSDSEKNGCRQEIYGANLAKGCLPCQTQRIARLSFRGFSSTARTRRPV